MIIGDDVHISCNYLAPQTSRVVLTFTTHTSSCSHLSTSLAHLVTRSSVLSKSIWKNMNCFFFNLTILKIFFLIHLLSWLYFRTHPNTCIISNVSILSSLTTPFPSPPNFHDSPVHSLGNSPTIVWLHWDYDPLTLPLFLFPLLYFSHYQYIFHAPPS